MALVDVAVKLARLVDQEGFAAAPDGATVRYTNANGPDWIAFRKTGEVIGLTSSWAPDHALLVPVGAFVAGVRRFLAEVASTLARRAPSLLQVEVLAGLRRYVPTGGAGA
jgi:hypothetical protein